MYTHISSLCPYMPRDRERERKRGREGAREGGRERV
jgi:hypothetical protein